MKTILLLTVPCLAILAPLTASAQSGGQWTMTGTIAGTGGGTSSGARWTVTGFAGRADAGPEALSARFTARGGFWPWAAAAQIPDGPQLGLSPGAPFGQPNSVRLSWNADAVGYRVQASTNLTVWTDTSLTPAGAGSGFYPNSGVPRLFFRLVKLP